MMIENTDKTTRKALVESLGINVSLFHKLTQAGVFKSVASGLCSPWRTWGQRAKSYLEAHRSKTPARLQAVVNTQLGELYRLAGEAPDWQRVAEQRLVEASGRVLWIKTGKDNHSLDVEALRRLST